MLVLLAVTREIAVVVHFFISHVKKVRSPDMPISSFPEFFAERVVMRLRVAVRVSEHLRSVRNTGALRIRQRMR